MLEPGTGLWARGKRSRKDDDDIFNDPLSYLLAKLLSPRQIFADCFAFLRQKVSLSPTTFSLTVELSKSGIFLLLFSLRAGDRSRGNSGQVAVVFTCHPSPKS